MQNSSESDRTRVQHVTVTAEDDGQRLDNWLLRIAKGVPKSHIYKLVRSGQVRRNGGRVKVSSRVQEGDKIRLPPMHRVERTEVRVPDKLQNTLRRSVLLEHDDFLIINKPPGIAVHGGSGLAFGAIDGLRQAFDSPSLELVHRLDRATSGALLVARDRKRCRALQEQFRQRVIGKQYIALVAGAWPEKVTTVDAPLLANREHAGERRVMVNHETGKPSVTHFEIQQRYQNATSLNVFLETGRTHQIRVHAAFSGCAIVGDDRYGDNRTNQRFRQLGLNRLFLHAARLEFQWQDESMDCNAPLPTEWLAALEQLDIK